jgi:HSP20 family molecular chaperone IbpA
MTHELTRPQSDQPPDPAESTSTDSAASGSAPVERHVFTPPIDIFETPTGLVLRADLPGVSLETLELQVQNNRLTLFGRVASAAPDGARLLHQEYHEGDYLRSFILSDNVDHERITAKLTNGVLEVFLPHAPEAEARHIQVSGS